MPVASIRTRTAGRRDEIGCSFDLADDGDGNLTAAINVIPPADSDGKGGRRPADIVCVVDMSGSMNSIAPAADGGEGDCLTRLDLVKHSLQTIIAVMKPRDRLVRLPGECGVEAVPCQRREGRHPEGKGRAAQHWWVHPAVGWTQMRAGGDGRRAGG